MKRALCFLFAALASAYTAPVHAVGAPSIPGDSVYRFDATLSDQTGTPFHLGERRGRPLLVAMFYTSCRYVCPLIIDSAKGVTQGLSETERARLNILLVSLDPARDDTAALRSVFDKRKLDATHWTLARTSENDVRMLAALLGVRYRALADGEFNHTSALVLLDSDGRRLASSEALGATPDPTFMAAVRSAIVSSQK
jgi:protein SCO1/2